MRIGNYEITIKKLHPAFRPIESIVKVFITEENINVCKLGLVDMRVVENKLGLHVTIRCYNKQLLIGKGGETVRALAGKISKGLDKSVKVSPITFRYE